MPVHLRLLIASENCLRVSDLPMAATIVLVFLWREIASALEPDAASHLSRSNRHWDSKQTNATL